MKIKRNCYGAWFVVFENNEAAYKWDWLFWRILRRPIVCFGQYENAYHLWG